MCRVRSKGMVGERLGVGEGRGSRKDRVGGKVLDRWLVN